MPLSPPSSVVSARDAALELQRRRAARQSLLAFTRYTFPEFVTNWHHALLAERLEAFAAGRIPRLAISMPPRHGKTELVVRRLVPYLLGRQPDWPIIFVTHTAALAGDECLQVQTILSGERYRRLFPAVDLAVRPRNRDACRVAGRAGGLRAVGTGQAIAGRGYRVAILDDLYPDQESAESPTQRAAVARWYSSDLLSRALPDAQEMLCFTRRHEDDLIGHVLALAREEPGAPPWEVLTLRAIRTDEEAPGDPRQPGEPLWPARYPLAFLQARQAASARDFAANYQQDPRPPGGSEWPASTFEGPGLWFDEWPRELVIKTMGLDPSKGADARASDYQALVWYGRTADGTEWVEADLARRPMTAQLSPAGQELSEGMVEHATDACLAFAAEGLGVEINQFQQLLLVPFREAGRRRGFTVPVYGIDNRVNKAVRIRRLGPPLGQRTLRFRRTPGTRLLVQQLRQFPHGDYDDGPDALEMARRLAIELFNGKSQQRRRC